MSVIVQKFGGTSVADATKIKAAAERAVRKKRAGHQVLVVVSARGKKTDELIALAKEITDDPPPREMDMLYTTGEQESAALTAMAVKTLGEDAVSFTGGQIGIFTDAAFTKARIHHISTDRMRAALDAGKIIIACGFQGVDEEGNITTLGRGGSDSTAAALAAVLEAEECEIYTDVEGIFTTDPRMVKTARKIDVITYDEMLELASLGAGVMHSRSIEFAKKYHVPLRVRPSYSDGIGTLIVNHSLQAPPIVTGVALVRNEARVSLCEIPDRPGVMSTIFSEMAVRKIPIDMVVQDVSSGGLAEVSFTVPETELADALTAAGNAIEQLGAGKVLHGTNVSKVSAVGVGMKTHTGVAAQMFSVLAGNEINIGMVTTSEIKISVLVDRANCETAINAVHDGFKLNEPAQTPPDVGFRSNLPVGEADEAREELQREVVAGLASMEDIVVSEVGLDAAQSRVTLSNLPDHPGVAAEIFTAVAEGNIMVDMIVQNVSHSGLTKLSFTVPRSDLDQCLLLTREVVEQWSDVELGFDRDIAKLSILGIGLRSHTGVGKRAFHALSEADINVQLINTSEVRMSAVIAAEHGERALDKLLEAFDLVPPA